MMRPFLSRVSVLSPGPRPSPPMGDPPGCLAGQQIQGSIGRVLIGVRAVLVNVIRQRVSIFAIDPDRFVRPSARSDPQPNYAQAPGRILVGTLPDPHVRANEHVP